MRFFLIVIFLSFSTGLLAQNSSSNTRAELERKRSALLISIKESQDQLEIIKKNKSASLSQLRTLQAKLDSRLALINNINDEIADINSTISTSANEVKGLKEDLNVLRERYIQSIRFAYRNRSSYSMLAFVFSAENYDDGLRRLKYLKRFRNFRKAQVEQIQQTQSKIVHKIGELNYQKSQKDFLLNAEIKQKQELQNETNETNNVVKELKSKEGQLAAEIRKNQQTAQKINATVNALIAKEIAEQRRKAEEQRKRLAAEQKRQLAEQKQRLAATEKQRQYEERKRKEEEHKRAIANKNNYGGVNLNTGSNKNNIPSNTTTNNTSNSNRSSSVAAVPKVVPRNTTSSYNERELYMTPEAIAVSNNFAANKGRLPWPVERGVIVNGYGQYKHPIANVMMPNDGINIQTAAGGSVRAVFEGEVMSVFSVPGSGQNVIITHGDYYTVYTNLHSVSVQKGAHIHTKQIIGIVSNNSDGVPVTNFQIWKSGKSGGANSTNPSVWISK